MSTDIHEGTLLVVRLVGPTDEGADRARWQFTLPSGNDQVTLRREEVITLATSLAISVATLTSPAEGTEP